VNFSEHEFECDRGADAAAYVLGALGEREIGGYREHLDSCAVCRQEIEQLAWVVDELPNAVSHHAAPGELQQRIMATVKAEAELLAAAGSQADRPVPARARWRLRPMIGALAASGALASGVLLGTLLTSGSSSPQTHITTAQTVAGASDASAVLREVGGHSELDVSGMPQPPGKHIYEVWLQRGDGAPQPTDALFSVTRSGSASVDVPGDLRGVSRVMVTAEPLGGSLKPTHSPVIVVRLS
jgi:hypothetical protein